MEESTSCAVAKLVIRPAVIAPGGDVTASVETSGCDVAADIPAEYEVVLSSTDSSAQQADYVLPVGRSGSGAGTFTVPEDFPIGDATFAIVNSPYPCSDTGSCALPEVEIRIAAELE